MQGALGAGLPPSPISAPALGNGQGPQPGPGMPAQGGQQQPGMPPPAPTSAQTVAALRHFAAITKELESALKDPDIGKADIKSKLIDGMTRLVGGRIMSAGQAVSQLATLPERPFEQKQWVMNHMQQAMQARDFVIGHHAAAFAGAGPEAAPHPDNHMQDITAMQQAHYAPRK